MLNRALQLLTENMLLFRTKMAAKWIRPIAHFYWLTNLCIFEDLEVQV